MGGEDLGVEDLGGEELGGEELGGEEEAPPGDELLLAEPGKRDEDWYKLRSRDALGRPKQTTTSKSKGKWYNPVINDKRKSSGPRKKNIKQKWANEKSRATERTYAPGYSPLRQLAKGLTEDKDTNYRDEERLLVEANQEIKNLISEMEKRDEIETQ
jgi:hypothetical protein